MKEIQDILLIDDQLFKVYLNVLLNLNIDLSKEKKIL
jgi:hypothetical protein